MEESIVLLIFTTIIRQITNNYSRSNRNKRPDYLDYSKMKQKAIEDLRSWSKDKQNKQIAEETEQQQYEQRKQDEENNEIDLLGMDDTYPGQKISEIEDEPQLVVQSSVNAGSLLPPPTKKQQNYVSEEIQQDDQGGDLDLLGLDLSPTPIVSNQDQQQQLGFQQQQQLQQQQYQAPVHGFGGTQLPQQEQIQPQNLLTYHKKPSTSEEKKDSSPDTDLFNLDLNM